MFSFLSACGLESPINGVFGIMLSVVGIFSTIGVCVAINSFVITSMGSCDVMNIFEEKYQNDW